MNYVKDLVDLICGNDTGQIDTFIKNVMREEDANYSIRKANLDVMGPTTVTPANRGNLVDSNNPGFSKNIISRLNTPFDHIERILLQDFSETMQIDSDNYFKSHVKFTKKTGTDYGMTKIEFSDDLTQSEPLFTYLNSLFSSGEFFIDSFTYTPFIDYSQTEYIVDESPDVKKTGVYSDQFLNDYNCGRCEKSYSGTGKKTQIDQNRQTLTSNMFTLRNLEQDIYDAKIRFRDAIDRDNPDAETDAKVYIYTFCEHLASLFAKLSNIRMSHEIYGFKHPHAEWEGILALDIWYQMLYHQIDEAYPFNDRLMNMNPMTRKKITSGKVDWNGEQLTKAQIESRGFEWIEDSSAPGYAYIWNQNLFDAFDGNANDISKNRADCVTPRGVLKKIHYLICKFATKSIPSEIEKPTGGWSGVPAGYSNQVPDENRDFDWFRQEGNVYSDRNKSRFTKYVNLHLGRAYDIMSEKDYHEKVVHYGKEAPVPENEKYVKNLFANSTFQQLVYKRNMIDCGYDALYDAFCVIKNEKLFNIFNSKTKVIDEFTESNAEYYSQGQCAIVIERIFSRLYKYLQFKSTTTEVFQRHINIDSGYKYLTSDAILNSDNVSPNGTSSVYYSEQDAINGIPDYLRYMKKLKTYENSGILTPDEKTILKQFIKVLSRKPAEWLSKNWNLCPLCESLSGDLHSLMALPEQKRSMMLQKMSRDGGEGANADEQDVSPVEQMDDEPVARKVVVKFDLDSGVWDGDSISQSEGMHAVYSNTGRPLELEFETEVPDGEYSFNLSQVVSAVQKNPYIDVDGNRINYLISGFSVESGGMPVYGTSSSIEVSDFGDSTTLTLHVAWDSGCLVRFEKGELDDVSGSMESFVTYSDFVVLDGCGYSPNSERYSRPTVKYYSSSYWKTPSQLDSGDSVNLYEFNGWTAQYGGRVWKVEDASKLNIPESQLGVPPVVTLTANWKLAYSSVPFIVLGKTYCEVLVGMDRKTIDVLPEPPVVDGKEFLWWDTMPGSYIGFSDRNRNNIVCENTQELPERTICESEDDADGPIICDDEDYAMNDTCVTAVFSDGYSSSDLTITFKFLKKDDSGQILNDQVHQSVTYNQHVPSFHIHQEIPFTADGQDYKYVFRYWKLESGTISSSMTVLSSSVLVAVYDQIVVDVHVEEDEIDHKPVMEDVSDGRDRPVLSSCENYLGQGNRWGCNYCKYEWVAPRMGSQDAKSLVRCPYVRLLLDGGITSNGDTFAPMTILEIEDISNLIKALFKINIDIAHREYFLKVDIPEESNWWYGEKLGKPAEEGDLICFSTDETTVCDPSSTDVVCLSQGEKWISFEPTVEFKFSNFHAANQIVEGKLVCTVNDEYGVKPRIVPINRDLASDENGKQYNDFFYYHDYRKSLEENFVKQCASLTEQDGIEDITPQFSASHRYYDVLPLSLYENSSIQSPVDVNDFIRMRIGNISRSVNQVRTYVTTLKKYRPVIMPEVRDLFDDCEIASETKYEADVNNNYGVFGWCTIPSKTMINMEYNEQSIIVPSSYDHHNRIGGSNFLQMDKDLKLIYTKWEKSDPSSDNKRGELVYNAKNTWYYLYNTRDWTYFLLPFFNVKQNNKLYSYMRDTYWKDLHDVDWRPKNSDHINGVIFDPSNEGRTVDSAFGDIASSCEFLAKYHHNENNLRTLSERYTNIISYQKLKELTQVEGSGEFNSAYGSQYAPIPENFRFPYQDWIDDYDKTGSYINLTIGTYKPNSTYAENNALKYRYNLGQSHAIDDFDERSVWFYITMVEPTEEMEQVIELEDIMPFVFWWENRGEQNNGPTAVCYGRSSSAKLNYEDGGWCYSNAIERDMTEVDTDQNVKSNGQIEAEQKWHAVQHTIGTDFSKKEYGGTVLTSDNSGNVYKGAFDPNCSGTDEKWKIHHPSNAFGANQNEDPVEDKYHLGYSTHGSNDFPSVVPDGMNDKILESLQDRPMTWNLWNVIRHYAYMKYFKNLHRNLGNGKAAWQELENYTKKIVKGIYRTFKDKQWQNHNQGGTRHTFSVVDGSSTNYGRECTVNWTNSFVEINTILERNARDHHASFVLFTGDERRLSGEEAYNRYYGQMKFKPGLSQAEKERACVERANYDAIRNSTCNFRVLTLEGVDGDDSEDGMRPRKISGNRYIWDKPEELRDGPDPVPCTVYQGFKYGDLPTTYVIGDSAVYHQQIPDVDITFPTVLDFDKEFPEAEYYVNSTTQKWVRRIRQTVMNRQLFPVYTSMEGMTTDVHDLTEEEMKSITFQVVPQFYWRYEWTHNDFMIHFVGRLNSPSKTLEMYDMLGNVWEWVRDDWTDNISDLNNKVNPIAVDGEDHTKKVIKGGAFDQLCRKVISPSREGLTWDQFQSEFGTQANVGFRPSMVYTSIDEGEEADFDITGNNTEPVDLFFLFDASASQNNQITEMLESAQNIVRSFAGNVNNKDVCHVGSALFLGPTIRFMCSQWVKTIVQKGWWWESKEYALESSSRYHGQPRYVYSLNWNSADDFYPWYANGNEYNINPSSFETTEESVRKNTKPRTGRENWVEIGMRQDQPNEWHFWSRTGADGNPSGLWNQFKDFRDNVWMAGSGSKGVENQKTSEFEPIPGETVQYDDVLIDTLEGPEGDIAKTETSDNMLKSRDGGGTGGTGGGGGGGGAVSYKYPTVISVDYSAHGMTKYMNVLCGVPAWKDAGENLHFGDIPPDDPTSDWSRYSYKSGEETVKGEDMFNSTFNFFTYNPTESGIDTFTEFPFTMRSELATYDGNPYAQDQGEILKLFKKHKGVLSNWWAGCEPTCDMLSKLLRYQCFYGFPYHIGMGYLFRKDVPRFVFVFTNEYDNSMVRTYSTADGTNEKEVVYAVTAEAGKSKVNNVTFTTRSDGILGSDQNAPDPYCLQLLRKFTNPSSQISQKFENYIDSINIKSASTEEAVNSGVDAVTWLGNESGIARISKLVYNTSIIGQKIHVGGKWKFTDLQNITYQKGYSLDLNQKGSPLGNPADPLTEYQKKYVEDHNGEFPWTTYRNPGETNQIREVTSFSYNALKTMGFYQLNLAFRDYVNYPLNTYLMLQDANAPTMLQTFDTEPDWNRDMRQEEREDIAWHLFPEKDKRLFKDLDNCDCPLPDEIDQILKSKGVTSNKYQITNSDFTKTFKWEVIRRVAAHYHSSWDDGGVSQLEAKSLDVIFGLENPYEKTTIVFARRSKFQSLAKEDEWKGKTQSYEKDNVTYYPFLLGIPTKSEVRTAWSNTAHKWSKWSDTKTGGTEPTVVVSDNENFSEGFKKWLKWNIWEKYDVQVPSEWIKYIRTWAQTISMDNAGDEVMAAYDGIPEQGRNWIDKHLCPWFKYNKTNRIGAKKMGKFNLTQENIELIGFCFKQYMKDGSLKTIVDSTFHPCYITELYSSESFSVDYGSGKNDNYAWTSQPNDYVTITYKRNGNPSGTLKIITLPNATVNTTQEGASGKAIALLENKNILVSSGFGRKVMKAINVTNGSEYPRSCNWTIYPGIWKNAASKFAGLYKTTDVSVRENSLFLEPKILKFVYNFYKNIKLAMPILLGYRFHDQIMSQYVNKSGKGVTDYDGNSVIVKSLPIMNAKLVDDTFESTFDGGNQFKPTVNFSYSHCVIDLNPENAELNGKFPMSFLTLTDVNQNEYKTSKIVLSRIGQISEGRSDTYTMGSRSTDYSKVTDPYRLKYRDSDSIVEASPNLNASVILGNGGSYQKNDLLYAVEEDGKKKYFKNRHFFIDPFELTIAQWCHAHGKHTKHSAIQLIGEYGGSPERFSDSGKEKLREMAKSFWKYLMVWEHDLFAEKKSDSPYSGDTDDKYLEVLYSEVDSMCDEYRTSTDYAYNPLEDTRPYYYATYKDVRGTTDVYANVTPDTELAKSYVMDSSKGDEFQMNSRTGTTSFMDILNNKVVYQTRRRIYNTPEPDGGILINQTAMDERDALLIAADENYDKNKEWCSGEEAGLNFDLPTEAQWEYCCRAGSESAFPMDNNLGQNFEERNESLDLISWYRYKVIGSLPEPERYCTWRISRMLFGISRDREMINNVYEYHLR